MSGTIFKRLVMPLWRHGDNKSYLARHGHLKRPLFEFSFDFCNIYTYSPAWYYEDYTKECSVPYSNEYSRSMS